MSLVRYTFALPAIVLMCGIAFAQSDTSSINGTVRDSSGAAVPNAKVTVRNEGTGLERQTQANESGNYTVTSLSAGTYTVNAEAPGFKKYQRTGNRLDANLPLAVDLTLEVGAVTETVDVVADAQRIQTETATVGKLVDDYQVRNLMLNGRNPVLLAALKPGVRSNASLANFNFNLTDGGFSMNGSRPNDNLFFYDGAVATRTRSNGTSIGAADVDSVQEIQILTANYNAEYGRSGGGQVRIITKSGTRDFHGDAYEYFRNSAMDANTWARNNSPLAFQNGQPQPLKYNQFGYDVSGPVFIPNHFNRDRNKLFFLFSQEWVRYRTEPSFTATVPTALMRQGNFSELLGPNIFYSSPQTVKDPATGNVFAGNIIPGNRVSKNGLGFLGAYPLPTPGFIQGRNNFIGSGPQRENQRKDTVSVDVAPNEKNTIRARFQNYNYDIVNAQRGNLTVAPDHLNRPNQTGSVNWIYIARPTLINEALATASADHVTITIVGDAWHRGLYGINYPYLYPAQFKDAPDKIATANIANFTQLDAGPYPARSGGPIYNFADNITWVHGNHSFKFGGLFERAGQNDRDQINVQGTPGGANNQAGRFDFQDQNGNIGIANAALGLFTSYAEIGPRSYTLSRGNMFEFFAQDSWRVNSKLKLEIGFRNTILQPYYALWGNYDVFNARFYDPAKAVQQDSRTGAIVAGSGDPYNGVVIPGSGWPEAARGRFPAAFDPQYDRLFRGLPRTYADTKYRNIVPRIGVAYQVNDKTVVRSGFGGFKNRPAVSDATFLGGNAPFQGFQVVSNGNVDNPGGSLAGAPPQFFMTQDPVWKIPTAYNWNFTVERQLPFASILEVAYVGRIGLYMERIRNINQLPVGTCPLGTCPGGVNVDVLRPYKGFSQIQIAENAARSTYNGLQLGLTRRFTKGFSYGVSYTYSKSYDNASGRRDTVWNAYDDRNYWGPSIFDTRHVAVINWIYELPFLRGQQSAAGRLLGGWQITGVTQFQTGTPFSVGTNTDFAGIGTASFQPWNVAGDPNLPRGDHKFSNGPGDNNYWLRTKDSSGNPLFTRPANGTFANQTKTLYYGPGFQNWNLGVFKTFTITERQRLSFRAEAFNWLNHPNWGGANGPGQFNPNGGPQGQPDGNPTSPTFGKVTTKDSRRQLQLSLRYSF